MIGPLEGDLAFDKSGVEDIGKFSSKEGSVEYLQEWRRVDIVLSRYSSKYESSIFCGYLKTIIPGVLM